MHQALVDARVRAAGQAQDPRTPIQKMRRTEIWLKLQAAGVEYDRSLPKEPTVPGEPSLLGLAAERGVDLLRAPLAAPQTDLQTVKEPTIHELRKAVRGIGDGKGGEGIYTWDYVKKLSKDEMREILSK